MVNRFQNKKWRNRAKLLLLVLCTWLSFGNVMSVAGNQPTFKLSTSIREVGKKYYELSGHKGTVGVVATDKKNAIVNGTAVESFTPGVVSWHDSYSYGSERPGRAVSSPDSERDGASLDTTRVSPWMIWSPKLCSFTNA